MAALSATCCWGTIRWAGSPIEYLLFTVGAAVVTAFVARYLHHLRTIFLLVDGLGLVAFCVIGCDIAMGAGMHPAIVVLAGMITGVFGGLLRDILCNQIPLVLQREVYATVALFTGSLYVGLLYFKVDSSVAQLASIGAGFLFRFLALHFAWRLPNFNGDRIRGFE